MSGALDIRAPAEQTEGTRSQLLRWLKKPGERVTENEPLIELETDKVTVEVPSPGSGVLREILKHEQDEIAPGELLGRIEVGVPEAAAGAERSGRGAASAAPAGAHAPAPPPAGPAQRASTGPSPAVRRLLAERGLTAAGVPGTGPGGRITVEDVLRAAAGNPAAVAPEAAPASTAAPPAAESAPGVRRV
ncbi:MAG TPA: biotin/lipoyl-containing protein, partial [Steroidobacteraceae bacterium]|nr:biotin/lipoyl-containing protein [Steroidobacteraceae bacterium]